MTARSKSQTKTFVFTVVAAFACLAISETTGWRTGICCFAASPITPGPLPESRSAWWAVEREEKAGAFASWMGHAWDESFKDKRREADILKKRGIPWVVRTFISGLRGSPRFKMEGDTVVMMTKLQPIGLVVSMRYPPKHKAITTVKEIPLPGFTVKDKTVTYHRGSSLVTESTTTLPTGDVVRGLSVATFDAKTDELVVEFTPGEKGETPWKNRFRRGKKL